MKKIKDWLDCYVQISPYNRFEVRRVSHSNYGTELPNGTWTGMVGALQKGEADACFSLSIGSYARSKVVRLGPVVSYQDNAILSGSETARFDAFEYLQAFDRKTWLMLFIALLVLAFLISLPDWLKSREGGNRGSSLGAQIHENAWTLFGCLLCECENGYGIKFLCFPKPFARISQRLLVGVWLAAVVILSNTFASLLKSRHAVGNSVPIADSIVDVAARSYLRPIIAAGTYYEQLDKFALILECLSPPIYGCEVLAPGPRLTQDSSSPHVKKVWEMARKKKGMVPLHTFFSDGNLRQVAERQAVMAMERGSMLFNMAAFCEREGVRNFYVAQQLIEQTPFVYMFSKHLDRRIYEEIFKK
ncbi:glutamate receptor ionotropic, kainate 5 [Ixodes scapularis]|uniref:glutamate receptor ionotropic, kainate 5 n=1 Tax=Ixodes scapularis TaxID=6945 RepID=UPI001C383CE5|nr:glutamate receptor ionotropic, kainate 5 [Ixodes scapularis]